MAITITLTIGGGTPMVFNDVQNIEISEAVLRLTRTVSTANEFGGVPVDNYGHAVLETDVVDLGMVSGDYTIEIDRQL